MLRWVDTKTRVAASARPGARLVRAPWLVACLFASTIAGAGAPSSVAGAADVLVPGAELTSHIRTMKESPTGPFADVRWFCFDGTVLLPESGSCSRRGGGVQRGAWSAETRRIRDMGFRIANVFEGMDVAALLRAAELADAIKQFVLEQYLIAADDGWIYRRARYHRGVLHAEGEAEAVRRLLEGLLVRPEWHQGRFFVLREAVRWLPHLRETRVVTKTRRLSSKLASADAAFAPLRNKIHVRPGPEDARSVREYAQSLAPGRPRDEYLRLAALLDRVHNPPAAASLLAQLAQAVPASAYIQGLARVALQGVDGSQALQRLAADARVLAQLRERISTVRVPSLALELFDIGTVLERDVFAASAVLRRDIATASRRTRLEWLRHTARAIYGIGLISVRQWRSVQEGLAALDAPAVPLDVYRTEVLHLSRVPQWAQRAVHFHFGESVERFATLDPLVRMFFDDRLRGSPLLFYADVVDTLLADANHAAGIRHEIFGSPVHTGLRALNPGIARGTLRAGLNGRVDPQGLYILPATTFDLPRVGGILTAGEGNALSHVQLLARNLGIPNVVVDHRLLPSLETHVGKRAVLAASPGGSVRIFEDGPRWDDLFGGAEAPTAPEIRVDARKLDLGHRRLLTLDQIRARDSGRVVGPKAAHLAELRHRFPGTVAQALVIPFGVFRSQLDREAWPDGPTMFAWMKSQYRELARLRSDPQRHRAAVARFLATVRNWILELRLGDALVEELLTAMRAAFGVDGSYGVFVRSDTNVEDLPGFNGAGLNLTVPHVVGIDHVLDAIVRVWASSFSEREYSWRQEHMRTPEHVYPSVLLMRSVAVEKSGVLVTVDIDTGRSEALSIAVNEGIGGAVAGQAAEELRVDTRSGRVRLLAQATAPRRRVLRAGGGLYKAAASGTDAVLDEREIRRLLDFARELPDRYPPLRDSAGNPVPADVEFGFRQGKLALFQIRPYLDSPRSKRDRFLITLDRSGDDTGARAVNLQETPGAEI